MARKRLDNETFSIFYELTGLRLQAVWAASWPRPTVCSGCRHAAATLAPGAECGHKNGDHLLADALEPQQKTNFSVCGLGGVRHQWHPLIVRGCTLGFLFIHTIDASEDRPEDSTWEPAGGRKEKSPEMTCCPPDAVVARLGKMQRKRAGILIKLMAANVESAIMVELNEAALSKVRLPTLGRRYEEDSRQSTLRLRVPDSPAIGSERQPCPHHQQIVQRMLDYLQSHFHLPIQLSDVAKTLKMNACYLSSLFSSTTGVTYNRYLQELRLAKAKELLADPGTLIGEVADATGFASAGTFCRTFKARTGLSPRAWRDGFEATIDNHF